MGYLSTARKEALYPLLLLTTVLFIPVFLSLNVSLVQAQSEPTCYETYSKALTQCDMAHTRCSFGNCADIYDDEERKACFAICRAAVRGCRDIEKSAFAACRSQFGEGEDEDVPDDTSKEKDSPDSQSNEDANNQTEQPIGVSSQDFLEHVRDQGVSSKDFRVLSKAQNELQQAQAELDNIKESHDPRWETKKDFADTYNDQLDKAATELAGNLQADKEDAEQSFRILRGGLERSADLGSSYLDTASFKEYLDKGDFGAYTKLSLVGDVASGITAFNDLIADGVSVEDATTKATVDTVGSSLLYLYPPLKVADMAATLPDKIMNIIGVPEDSSFRKNTTGYLASNSPGGFVKLTTDTMIKTQNWTNAGGALSIAVKDVRNAEGFVETMNETVNFVGTAIGAVPVSAALAIRDTVSGAFSAGGAAVNWVSSWFTYPNE